MTLLWRRNSETSFFSLFFFLLLLQKLTDPISRRRPPESAFQGPSSGVHARFCDKAYWGQIWAFKAKGRGKAVLYGSGGNSVALASRRRKGVFVTLPAILSLNRVISQRRWKSNQITCPFYLSPSPPPAKLRPTSGLLRADPSHLGTWACLLQNLILTTKKSAIGSCHFNKLQHWDVKVLP